MPVTIDEFEVVEEAEPARPDAPPRAREDKQPDQRKLLECIAYEQWRSARLTAD